MKKIGIIGGMSYESTAHYYLEINRKVNKMAGGQTSADLLIRSVNFADIDLDMRFGRWKTIGERILREAMSLRNNDCDYIAIATNTIHKVAEEIEPSIRLVHIGDCIAEECEKAGAKNVIFLGTRFTMLDNFMDKRLEKHGIKTVDLSCYDSLPYSGHGLNEVHRIIFDELCHGTVRTDSKAFLLKFIDEVREKATEKPDAVVLGCTELDMILKKGDIDLPIIDSTEAHINKLAKLALS